MPHNHRRRKYVQLFFKNAVFILCSHGCVITFITVQFILTNFESCNEIIMQTRTDEYL